jgi:hypothetical protein
MKETTMYIDDLAMTNKNNIGFTGEVAFVKTITIAHPVNYRSYQHLRAGISTANARHVEAALL